MVLVSPEFWIDVYLSGRLVSLVSLYMILVNLDLSVHGSRQSGLSVHSSR